MHEDLLKETDEYDQLMEVFKVFDEDGNGQISALEQQDVSERLLLPNADSALGTIMELTSKFKEGTIDAEEVFDLLVAALVIQLVILTLCCCIVAYLCLKQHKQELTLKGKRD